LEYYELEKQEPQATKVHMAAKDELARFNMVTSEYEKVLKQQQKNHLSDVERQVVEAELSDVVEEQTLLQDTAPITKAEHVQARKLFAAEKKKPENGNAFGQPINAIMDEVLNKVPCGI
jgi:hypothetical protein